MSEVDIAPDRSSAEFIAFTEFRGGLPNGQFRVEVNSALAGPFVARRLHAAALTILILVVAVASAFRGHPVPGLVLLAVAIALRAAVKWQAPKILRHLASRRATVYYDATGDGVMQVRRA